jgi:hypothetical protein
VICLKKIFFVLIISFIFLLTLGCTQNRTTCGNTICETFEEGNCLIDCPNEANIESIAKMGWSQTTPFAISNWDFDNGLLSLTILNNTFSDLEFNGIKINQNGEYEIRSPSIIEAGETITVTLFIDDAADKEGYEFYIDGENILIDYNSSSLLNQNQIGLYPIVD